jgi:outer membrane biosynthesis protein TonB
MIPRTLVPVDARPPAQNGAEPSTRRRPTALDERTLVPAMLPIIVLDGRTNIPASLPLDAISARVVVPRDINREAYGVVEDHSIPLQPTELDERVTVPVGSKAPEIVAPPEFTPPDIVSPDVFTSGEVHLVAARVKEETAKWDAIKLVASITFHVVLVFALIQFFARRPTTQRDEEIARQIFTPLVAPNMLDLEQPRSVAPPAPHIKVDPRVVAKVAPTPPKPVETPKIPEPPRELPASPVAKSNSQPPALENAPAPKSDTPKPQLQLEVPDVPTPNSHLQLPKSASSGSSLNDLLHGGAEKPSGPRAIGGGGPVRSGGQGRGGAAYGGLEMLTPDEGVDFSGYLQRVYLTVKRNWFAVMPSSVELGEKGIVQLTFRIYRDGSVHSEDPQILHNSGKEPLDRAAYSSVRASNPFDQLPPQFSGPYIELRYTYFYNIVPSSLGQ